MAVINAQGFASKFVFNAANGPESQRT